MYSSIISYQGQWTGSLVYAQATTRAYIYLTHPHLLLHQRICSIRQTYLAHLNNPSTSRLLSFQLKNPKAFSVTNTLKKSDIFRPIYHQYAIEQIAYEKP